MKSTQATTSNEPRKPEPREYAVRLTPKGERYVAEEAARRTLAKLATAADLFMRAERRANGDQHP